MWWCGFTLSSSVAIDKKRTLSAGIVRKQIGMFTKYPAVWTSYGTNSVECQLKQKTSWETAIATGQQDTPAEDRRGLCFVCFIVLFFSSCVKCGEQKQAWRGIEEGLNSRGFTVQMFAVPSAMQRCCLPRRQAVTFTQRPLHTHHVLCFHVGIQLYDSIQLLNSPVLNHSGPFFPSLLQFRSDIWLFSISYAPTSPQHPSIHRWCFNTNSLFLYQPR